NLKLEKGKKYLLVGKNGSGKTTLLKLINRNYRDFKGEILINGKSCFDISSDSFYKSISMVYQEPYIFADSIQDNITMYKIYDKKSYLNIIKKVGITAEILNKDNNVQHLSGGDKQRVALARALISNPQFLLLDEACSALDIKSRGIIEKNILNEDSAVISVSHNYDENILRKYDEIIFMQDGRIIQMDRYENLSPNILNWLNTNNEE
ncbi:MAG: ABC transporter ATP-binding protein, partial [Oscillospiraceae bacterium]